MRGWITIWHWCRLFQTHFVVKHLEKRKNSLTKTDFKKNPPGYAHTRTYPQNNISLEGNWLVTLPPGLNEQSKIPLVLDKPCLILVTLCTARKNAKSKWIITPIGSMEWLTFVANVGKYTSPMDPMGRININNKLNDETWKSRIIDIFYIHQNAEGREVYGPRHPVIPPEVRYLGYVVGVQSYRTSVSVFGCLG